MADLRPRAVPSARQVLRGKIQVARILQLTPAEFTRTVEELESSPLFQKLFSSESGLKVIHRRSFSRAALSSRFYELDESRMAAPPADIQKALERRQRLVELIRRMGREKFETFFLYDDGTRPREEIQRECGVKASELDAIRTLMNEVFLEADLLGSTRLTPESAPAVSYNLVAQVVPDPQQGYSLAFFSPVMARGLYQVDHQKLLDLRREGKLTPEERRELNALLSRIGLVNARKNTLYQTLLRVLDAQKDFFADENPARLRPLTQRRLAADISVAPSSVCRLVYGRSLESPSGREYPLDFFFPSRKDWVKGRLGPLLDENAGLTDEELRNIIKQRFGETLSRRSVNQYRRELAPRKRR